MWENIDVDRHYIGAFNILDEEISGELIYNKQNGVILLNITKEIDLMTPIGKMYGNIPVITGRLNSGAVVTLFDNRCVKNHTQIFSNQQLNFVSKYLIWSKSECVDSKYNKMICTLKNAFEWSMFSTFEKTGTGIRVKKEFDKKSFNWFGFKITFSAFLNQSFLIIPIGEETKIVQRLTLEIESDEKHSFEDFILIRNKIISLISFAIKNNVNIEEQYLLDYNLYLTENDIPNYHKHYLLISEPTLDTLKTKRSDYNFWLKDLKEDKDINDCLNKLEPIFNLYLSLFKYPNMPHEMVFLNIVQALETFHSRFYYDNQKSKYIKSVKDRFGDSGKYRKLLLSDTQIDENCNYIILVSRINDLLIGKDDGLFCEYYLSKDNYAQIIADTRHYYTHYGKEKEKKALKGDDLLEAIFVLSALLEYHVCLAVGIDRRNAIAQELQTHENWKQLSEAQTSTSKNNKSSKQ